MLRAFVRFGIVAGLAALALAVAASALAAPPARSGVAPAAGPGSHPQPAAVAPDFSLALSKVVSNGLTYPVGMANAGDGSGRLFVVEQAGDIRVVKNGTLLSTPYLTLTNKVLTSTERGLLSVAFDPDYKTNGTFYVDYTARDGAVTIERYIATDPASDVVATVSSTVILTVTHPGPSHNGGQLQFGPDGYLYAGLGDGGGAGDPHGTIGNGQDPAVLLGKILRLNVRGVPTYTIPVSNPFTRTVGYRPEIWALGVRNPWRFSFDQGAGDLYIGDVGQDCFEEIDYQAAASHGGENYGWRLMEGFHQFDPGNMTNCTQPIITPAGVTRPITEYPHTIGVAVSGGFVYRGQGYPWLSGWYFYGDYGAGLIWVIKQTQPGVWSGEWKLSSGLNISSFGEDEQGELYVASYSEGAIYKITSTAPADFSGSTKQASTSIASTGDILTYTIVVRNVGGPLTDTVRVTDVVPAELTYMPGTLTTTYGAIDASAAPTLKWSGVMSAAPAVTLTYAATVSTLATKAVANTVAIDPGGSSLLTRTVIIMANPRRLFLPLILRNS